MIYRLKLETDSNRCRFSNKVCNFEQTLLGKKDLMVKWSFTTEMQTGGFRFASIGFLGS